MTIEEILKLIDDSVNGFNESIPSIQRQLYIELTELANKLDTRNGRIVISGKNIKLISQIRQKFDRVITKNKPYNKRVKAFIDTFAEVGKMQTQYFEETHSLKPPSILEQIRIESVNTTIENLKGAGMKATIIEPIRDILKTNITSGAKKSDLDAQLRERMLDSKTGDGELVRYVKQITTDALNGYARENVRVITKNTGMTWWSYTGAIIDTSRDFCKALHKKKYFHESEIPDLLKGNFKEFKDLDGKIYDKTGLPYGMKAGTTKDNFLVEAGGWSCNHVPIPVDELAVPERIKNGL